MGDSLVRPKSMTTQTTITSAKENLRSYYPINYIPTHDAVHRTSNLTGTLRKTVGIYHSQYRLSETAERQTGVIGSIDWR